MIVAQEELRTIDRETEPLIPERFIQEQVQEEYSGICSTCNDADSCYNRIRSKTPIWFCEEFDDRTDGNNGSGNPAFLEEIVLGLCSICGLRDICRHDEKKAADIAHCEWFVD